MRVVQLLGSSAGGVSQHVAQVASLLGNVPGAEVLVAAPSALREKFDSVGRFAPVEISDRPGFSDFRTLTHIKSLSADADVLHAHGLRAGAMAGLALFGVRGSKRPRLVVTLHNLPVGGIKVQSVTGVLEAVVAKSADVVLGVSTDIVERMRSKGAKVGGRALVPAPVLRETTQGTEQTRRELLGAHATHTHLVVTIARLAPQKGLDTAIAASRLVKAAGVEHTWVVAGDGPLRASLEEQIQESGAPVRLLGRRTDIPELLAAADVVVNAAVWEGQPVAVQEALRAGAAIVATDVGGTRETAGDAVLYVQDSNPQAMKIAVEGLLTNQAARTTYQERARTRSGELPSESDVLESLLSVYRKTV